MSQRFRWGPAKFRTRDAVVLAMRPAWQGPVRVLDQKEEQQPASRLRLDRDGSRWPVES